MARACFWLCLAWSGNLAELAARETYKMSRTFCRGPVRNVRGRNGEATASSIAPDAHDMLWKMLNHGKCNGIIARHRDAEHRRFRAALETVFEMDRPAGVVPLKLAKTESAGQSGRREGGAFSLLFVAPAGPVAAAGDLSGPASGARHHGDFPGAGRADVRRQRLSRGVHVRRCDRCSQSRARGPAHQIVDALVFLGRESEPPVQPHRRD